MRALRLPWIVACLIALCAFGWPVSAQELPVQLQVDPLPEGVLTRLGTTRLRHGGTVNGVAFSPDGKQLATCAWEDSIRIWDPITGRQLQRLQLSEGDATFAVAYSP